MEVTVSKKTTAYVVRDKEGRILFESKEPENIKAFCKENKYIISNPF